MVNASDPRCSPTATGALSRTPLAHLLIYTLERRLTGTLDLFSPSGERATLVLADGEASKIRLSEPVAYLGRVLLDLGLLEEEQLTSSLQELARTRRLHGQILLESGTITEAKLHEGLRVQLVRKVHHLFTLPQETTFAYYDAVDMLPDYGGRMLFSTDLLPVVWRGVFESPPWELVQTTLARVNKVRLKLTPQTALFRFGFDPDQLTAAELLRARPMNPAEFMAIGVLSARSAQLLLYFLLITKQVVIAVETVTADANDAFSEETTDVRQPWTMTPPPTSYTKPVTPSVESRVSMRSASLPVTRPSLRVSGLPPQRTPSLASLVPPRRVPPAPMGTATQSTPALFSTSTGLLTPPMMARRDEILAVAGRIDKQNYFEMLGITQGATPEEARAAYFELAKQWHPDRLPQALASVREHCAHVFARMSEAHQTLTDRERRTRYMALVEDGGATPEAQATIASVVEAATNFQKAEICARRGDMQQAELLCRSAYEADPKQADYLAMLTWLEALKPENQTPKATLDHIAKLDKAIQLNERCERAYFYRGQLHKRMQNHRAAVRDFREAADLNPRNIDAMREVRLFAMRKRHESTGTPSSSPGSRPSAAGGVKRRSDPTPASKGLLGKLFKK